MDEYFKVLRQTHRVILLLCVTAVAISLVPRSTFKHWLALSELDLLERFEDTPLRFHVSLYLEDLLEKAGRDTKVLLSLKSGNSEDWISEYLIDRSPNTITRLLTASFDEPNISFRNAALSQIRKASEYPFRAPIPSDDEVEQLLDCIDSGDDEGTPFIRITVLYDSYVSDLAVDEVREKQAKATVNNVPCMDFNLALTNLSLILGPTLEGGNWSVLSKVIQLNSKPGKDSLSLFELSDYPVWEVVRDNTVFEAREKLQELVRSREIGQDVLGFSFSRLAASYFIPIFMTIALLSMCLHVQETRRKLKTPKELEFPWIGLYSDYLSRLLTFGSLTVIPYLALRYMFEQASFPLSTQIYFLLVNLCIGVFIWIGLHGLLSKFLESPNSQPVSTEGKRPSD